MIGQGARQADDSIDDFVKPVASRRLPGLESMNAACPFEVCGIHLVPVRMSEPSSVCQVSNPGDPGQLFLARGVEKEERL